MSKRKARPHAIAVEESADYPAKARILRKAGLPIVYENLKRVDLQAFGSHVGMMWKGRHISGGAYEAAREMQVIDAAYRIAKGYPPLGVVNTFWRQTPSDPSEYDPDESPSERDKDEALASLERTMAATSRVLLDCGRSTVYPWTMRVLRETFPVSAFLRTPYGAQGRRVADWVAARRAFKQEANETTIRAYIDAEWRDYPPAYRENVFMAYLKPRTRLTDGGAFARTGLEQLANFFGFDSERKAS